MKITQSFDYSETVVASVWTEVVFFVVSTEYLEDSAKDNIKHSKKGPRKNVWTRQHQTPNLLPEQAQRRNWGKLSWLTLFESRFHYGTELPGAGELGMCYHNMTVTWQGVSDFIDTVQGSGLLQEQPVTEPGPTTQASKSRAKASQGRGSDDEDACSFLQSCLPARDRLTTAACMQWARRTYF